MNMQYARAVLAHEQAYRDRARANHVNVSPKTETGGIAVPARSR
ncbi:MAG: hypothetical protein WAM92_06805 [Mycobacterium sp.]